MSHNGPEAWRDILYSSTDREQLEAAADDAEWNNYHDLASELREKARKY